MHGSHYGYFRETNTLRTITRNFSKRVTILSGKSTFSAEQWAVLVLDRLHLADWGIPAAIGQGVRAADNLGCDQHESRKKLPC